MTYQLVVTKRFEKQAKKLVRKNPGLKDKVKKTLKELRRDVKHPGLRWHKLSGRNNWSVAVNQEVRIIIHWSGRKLYLVEMGSHDEVYRN